MHSRPLLLLPLLATGCGAQWGAPQATPEQIVGVLQPKLTFDLRDADYEAAAAATAAEDGDEPWRRQAQLVASTEELRRLRAEPRRASEGLGASWGPAGALLALSLVWLYDAVVLSLCDFLACGGERMEVITSPLCHRFAAHCCRRGSCALLIAGARR